MNESNKLNLENVVFKAIDLKEFIDDKKSFIEFNATKLQLHKMQHPFELYNFNRVVKSTNNKYALFNIPISEMAAYFKNNDYCLYLLININSFKQIQSFVDKLGFPWNVTKDDYEKNDYDMLLWQKDQLKISLMNNFDGQKILIITNLPKIELNPAEWE